MTIQVRPNIYLPGTGGIPSTSRLAPFFPADRYEHTITALGGFESLSLTGIVDKETALYWLTNGLMNSVVVSGPDAQTVWEGAITGIEVTLGQERRSISLEPMANAITVRYATPSGVPGFYPTPSGTYLSNTASQAIYGIKQAVLSAGQTDSTSATNFANRSLKQRAWPRAIANSTVATGPLGGIEITLLGTGWYYMLDWLSSGSVSATVTSTTTQIQNLITAYNAVNAFYSTTYSNIAASGRTASEQYAPDTTYRARIEQLLSFGNSADARLVGGVYEDRQFAVNVWAGETPDTIHYHRKLGSGLVTNSAGASVQPWDVRPDRNCQTDELLDVNPVATAPDAAARFYVERVKCTIDQNGAGVTLEPETSNSLDAMLARIGEGLY